MQDKRKQLQDRLLQDVADLINLGREPLTERIYIGWSSYEKYGCPNCGAGGASTGHVIYCGSTELTCFECGYRFLVGNDDECPLFHDEHIKMAEHPREGIPWHPTKFDDPKPEFEYCRPRGVGYDLACFVSSREAGLRVLDQVKSVLFTDNPSTWLDYREREPKWIQVKFQKEEFDVNELHSDLTKYSGILYPWMLEKNINKEVQLSNLADKEFHVASEAVRIESEIYNFSRTICRDSQSEAKELLSEYVPNWVVEAEDFKFEVGFEIEFSTGREAFISNSDIAFVLNKRGHDIDLDTSLDSLRSVLNSYYSVADE